EKVVDQELVITPDFEVPARKSLAWIVVPIHVRDDGRICQARLAHPNPGPAPLFNDGICSHLPARGNMFLAGDADALPRGVELQPVISASHAVAGQLSQG